MPKKVRRAAAALAAAVSLAAATPARADSTVTIRVELYYGVVVAGGFGLAVWISGGWETWLGERAPATALLEVAGGRVRPGVPLPVAAGPSPGAAAEPASGSVSVDLVRIRF